MPLVSKPAKRALHSSCLGGLYGRSSNVTTTSSRKRHLCFRNNGDRLSATLLYHHVHNPSPVLELRRFISSGKDETKQEKDHSANISASNVKISDATTTNTSTSVNQEEKSQFWAHWIRELQSPPNVITVARIAATPLLSYWIVSGQHDLAFYGCIIAAASDYVDGYLAKNYNMATVLGGYLDPMADKIFINVLAVSLCYTGILPTPLVGLWLGRDVLLVVGAARHVRSHSKNSAMAYDPVVTPLKVNPTNLSKANTAFQFITLGVGIVYPLYSVPPELLTGLW